MSNLNPNLNPNLTPKSRREPLYPGLFAVLHPTAHKHIGLAILIVVYCFVVLLAIAICDQAFPHDIYTGVTGKNGQLCCGGNDCSSTVYREVGGHFEFLTREKTWVAIPQERITFLPIPGDPPSDDSHHAHLCYRSATDWDRSNMLSALNVFGNIFLYCAFIPPGGV